MTEEIIMTITDSAGRSGIVSGTNPRRATVSAINCIGKPNSAYLVGGVLDVDTSFRYVTGFTASGAWQVNRRNRSTNVVTSARPDNNPSYSFTTTDALRAARGTLTYD